MASIPQDQWNEWVFITTTPKRPRPTKGQRSQMRRRVMREIGYSRRNVQTRLSQNLSMPCTSSDITASVSNPRPSLVERQYGSFQSAECPTASIHISSFLASPALLDKQSQRLLYHSTSLHLYMRDSSRLYKLNFPT